MQTFLPDPNFLRTGLILDDRRLGKQRVEGLQILQALMGKSKGWRNHPATRMWKGYEVALATYVFSICEAWKARGFKDTVQNKIINLVAELPESKLVMPPWLGDSAFHASHRSNLLRKDFEFYSKYGWSETPDLPYHWPQEVAA